VRLHPYHSERILAGSGALSVLAPLAGRHHEFLDGSGYHRGCTARDLPTDARVLAAAATYRTKTEPRPHRPALTRELARDALYGRARRGELDPDAVGAVLQAAGHRAPRQRPRPPAGLSEREAEVLTLLDAATGRSPTGSWSPAAPRSTTSSTSTPRSASPAGRPPRSSPSSTASSGRTGRDG
jgi:hypothetical protein